jgi:hypothetical protein
MSEIKETHVVMTDESFERAVALQKAIEESKMAPLDEYEDEGDPLEQIIALLVEIRDIVGAFVEGFGLVARIGQNDDEPGEDSPEDRTRDSWARRSET